jgi:MoaA/NifB/PqqE/SkfB family radical SAM enzyme
MKTSEFFNSEFASAFGTLLLAMLRWPRSAPYYLSFIKNQLLAALRRRRFEKKGVHVPIFLIMSITKACNLRCVGCYSHAADLGSDTPHRAEMRLEDFARVFSDASESGIGIIMIAGGEPFMRREVIELCSEFKRITFAVYTNGTLMTDDDVRFFARHKNLQLYFSIEGNEALTDLRRGEGVYARVAQQMEKLKKRSIFHAVSMTVTSENSDLLVSRAFIRGLVNKGCRYFNFVEFESVEPGTEGLRLDDTRRERFAQEVERLKSDFRAVIFASFPGFEYKSGGCLAAGRGFFHINAYGNAEPCNFVPISDTSVIGRPLLDALDSPLFQRLRSGDMLRDPENGACALLSKPDELSKIAGDVLPP